MRGKRVVRVAPGGRPASRAPDAEADPLVSRMAIVPSVRMWRTVPLAAGACRTCRSPAGGPSRRGRASPDFVDARIEHVRDDTLAEAFLGTRAE
jgi:hypothetical protein